MIAVSTPPGLDEGQIRRTDRGAVLFAASAASLLETAGESLFDPDWWRGRAALHETGAGRGSAWFVEHGAEQWVLRHYRRGGLPGRILHDRFLWLGETRVRAFAEWRLTAELFEWGLPVPLPVAARYTHRGASYRCDLITRRIEGAAALSACLSTAPLALPVWREVGVTVARLHARGVDHADLNAHNILLGPSGTVSVVDFDRCRVRVAGPWRQRNLLRLRRSLLKISRALPAGRFGEPQWRELLQGYGGH